jgi:hypothetical protein
MALNIYNHNFNEPLYAKDINLDNIRINAPNITFDGRNINLSGIMTARSYFGDGSNLTGITLDITSSLFI